MFVRKVRVEYAREGGEPRPCPLAWIDNFAMRNFTNSAIFDDTLPIGDGRMEVGLRVPLDALSEAMDEWFRRKGYLRQGDRLLILEEQKPGRTD
ncbi:MAG TPA: hypothetical protein VGM02_09820 [Acidobacteriaceae bacterium]|jgi:hypothetical protein